MKEDIDFKFRDKKDKSSFYAKQKATDKQWNLVDIAIKSFIREYPSQWNMFQKSLNANRTKYQLATKEHKELRSAGWRNAASFPVIEDEDGNIVDSILPTLQNIIPGLTHKDSVNLETFLKKYPSFRPGEK